MKRKESTLQHALPTKFLILLSFSIVIFFILYLGYRAPNDQNDICQLFANHPSWYQATLKTQKKWGVPISVQMAIIKRESHFRAYATPPHKRLLGFIPWAPISSAHGYMQALNSTWQDYLKATKQRSASRSNFANATDFIGWYVNDTHKKLRYIQKMTPIVFTWFIMKALKATPRGSIKKKTMAQAPRARSRSASS